MILIIRLTQFHDDNNDDESSSWWLSNNDDSSINALGNDNTSVSSTDDTITNRSIISNMELLDYTSDLSDEDDDMYEQFLVYLSLLYNETLNFIHEIHNEMFDHTVLRQSDVAMLNHHTVPKINRVIADLDETDARTWTRFTKSQLLELKDLFFLNITMKR